MSFIRNRILLVIVGKPPADAAQPSGMNGMMVMVMMRVTTEPASPRMPGCRLYGYPARAGVNDHASATTIIVPPDVSATLDPRCRRPMSCQVPATRRTRCCTGHSTASALNRACRAPKSLAINAIGV
jgi:hypothetical protein